MDKKTLIILGISIAFLMIWSFVMQPNAPVGEPVAAQQNQEAKTAQSPAATPAVAPQAPEANSPALAEASSLPGREITIETPNYTAVLDENGGRLKRFNLKHFKQPKMTSEAKDVPVNLVSVPDSNDWSLPLTLTDEGAPKLGRAHFRADQEKLSLAPGEKKTLTMTSSGLDGLLITRTFTFDADSYYVAQKVAVNNQGQSHLGGQLSMRINSAPFSPRTTRYNSMAAFINGSLETDTAEDAAEALGDFAGKLTRLDWLGYMDQYFLTTLVFPKSDEGQIPTARAVLQTHSGLAIDAAWNLDLAPGNTSSYDFDFYYGPKEQNDLEKAGHHLEKAIDLGWFTFLAKPLAFLLRLFYSWVHNYGVAIILVTILIKIVLWPLTAKSYRSMKAMQKLQPKVAKLREKYADDKETMNKEVMRLYKTFKVNPFGGCLPLLLQIPFFIAFYRVLDYALELRGAPFMLWINDLSAPDRLGSFAVKIPLMDLPTGIPVLTLLMGASMFWQQKMTPTMGDPTQAKIMLLMPVIFTFILINMPAGLVLYWFVNNILSIGQQKLINRNKNN